jgi:hypothetical protein
MSSLTIKNAVVIPITAAEKSFDGYVGVKECRFSHGEFLTAPPATVHGRFVCGFQSRFFMLN